MKTGNGLHTLLWHVLLRERDGHFTGAIAAALIVFAPWSVRLFSPDQKVIEFGVLFIRTNTFFLLFNCINHVLAGALRGRGDSRGPMVCMLACFVGIRQIYLFIGSRIAYNPYVIGFGYPVGWMTCCVAEVAYFMLRWNRKRPA